MGLATVVFSPALGTRTPAVGFEKKLFTRTPPLPPSSLPLGYVLSLWLVAGHPIPMGLLCSHPSIHTTSDRLIVMAARL